MKTWNMTKLSDLEGNVLQSYEDLVGRRRRTATRQVVEGIGKAVIVSVTAVAALNVVVSVQTTSPDFSFSVSERNDAYTGDIAGGPPLEALFAGAFEGEEEEELLLSISRRSLSLDRKQLVDQTVESILFNLHEDVSEEGALSVTSLSREDIRKIVTERKLL